MYVELAQRAAAGQVIAAELQMRALVRESRVGNLEQSGNTV